MTHYISEVVQEQELEQEKNREVEREVQMEVQQYVQLDYQARAVERGWHWSRLAAADQCPEKENEAKAKLASQNASKDEDSIASLLGEWVLRGRTGEKVSTADMLCEKHVLLYFCASWSKW